MPTKQIFALALTLLASLPAAEVSSADLYSAIRNNDLPRLKTYLPGGTAANLADRRGATPLMHAAAIGSVEAMKLLLAAGADANARDSFDATALLWGARDIAKVRLLLDRGADPKARSKQGQTPLLIAAATPGSIETVRLLVAKGADPKASGASGLTTLHAAARASDAAMLQFFLDKGVDVHATDVTDKTGNTALMAAAAQANLAAVKLLLRKGSDVNATITDSVMVKKGPLAFNNLTALMLAAPYASPDLIRTLLDAGAKVNVKDIRGMTPLMLAVGTETQDPKVVKMLLDAGADANAKDVYGQTALDWARKYGDPPVLRVLNGGGAPRSAPDGNSAAAGSKPDVRSAVETSVGLLQRSTTQFFRESGCIGCHHQNTTAMAVGAARAKGIHVDDSAAAEHQKAVMSQWAGFQSMLLQRIDFVFADPILFSLIGLAAENYPPDAITDAMVINMISQQFTDGRWPACEASRAPLMEGEFHRIAMAIRAMRVYGPPALKPELDEHIARGRRWLLAAHPKTTDDRTMLLLGLHWSAAEASKVKAAGKALLAAQHPDGGWAQNPNLDSDAYATGQALYALHEAGAVQVKDTAYQRGLEYLLRTRNDDGSWLVHSRAPKFQPYFESGFPHGHDQWISASATAWATVALARALP